MIAVPHDQSTRKFWEKFDRDAPSLADMRVLEIGCGLGQRSFEAAEMGASSVLGIDISASAVAQAKEKLVDMPDSVTERVRFEQCKVEDLPDDGFDVVLSEDTFEHILDPAEALSHIKAKLRSGGYVFLGFAPLYHSPYGDHSWIQSALPTRRVPWSHLLLPQRLTYRLMSRHYGKPIKDTVDWPFLALNQLTVHDFKKIFRESGMKMISFQTERHRRHLAGRLFDALGTLPFLQKYFTAGIYCVLQK